MNKSLITLGIIGFIILLIGFNGCGSYNTMQRMDEEVNGKWHDVEVVYQRRSDLIPNLVQTVQGYANFEKSTLQAVVEARANATKVTIDPSKLTPETMRTYQAAQGAVTSSLGRLLAVAENYPDLKANQNFMDLQKQLEGTENRIAEERRKFNDAVKELNSYVRIFPRNIWAGMFGIQKRGYFESDAGAEKAPQVKFDIK